MGEPAMLRLDGLPLAGRQSQPRQLFHLPCKLLALGVACCAVLFVVLSCAAEPLPFDVSLAGVAGKGRETRVRVEHQALGLGLQKRLVGMLAVDVDELLSRLAQLVDRGSMAVYEAA